MRGIEEAYKFVVRLDQCLDNIMAGIHRWSLNYYGHATCYQL